MAGLRLVPKGKKPGLISFEFPAKKSSGEEAQEWTILTRKGLEYLETVM